jgi:hypothetical protein
LVGFFDAPDNCHPASLDRRSSPTAPDQILEKISPKTNRTLGKREEMLSPKKRALQLHAIFLRPTAR